MADTIRILVATDNHVGAHERDPHRSDDSWKTFHEIMELARDREVDMVLLAGDLFHENKPSRKSMYNVMRSLRLNSLGARPCELEILSDGSEQFDATFDHVNYEDPDINVSIPVFSIHGNHDDPSGEGHYAALDLLAMSGLVNYFGRTPESDKIDVKPVLLQKGNTKLALYGLSNVRDERLWRTFNEQGVTFYQPGTQQSDWYSMICVHQNHHAHSDTNYLPENVLPRFLDLVIWGHEHECLINPRLNPEMNFHVIQPGSSVATSLIPGEAVPKQVTILSITGRELKNEPIRLRTVRPFVYKDVVLAQDPIAVKIGRNDNHRTKLTAYLISIVEGMIEQAKTEWKESEEEAGAESDVEQFPLPLIRLRVEYTSANGLTKFEVENPQRFSNRFQDRVANTNDVIQFHIKKRSAAASAAARAKQDAVADQAIMQKVERMEDIRVEKLVKEFLEAQSLTILPTTVFGDAVNNYVEKDDKNAVEDFVKQSLKSQVALLGGQQDDDESEDEGADLMVQIQEIKEKLEAEFAEGLAKSGRKKKFKPKPRDWDTDEDGLWEEQPGALIRDVRSQSADDPNESDENGTPAPPTAARGRGSGRGRGARATTSTKAKARSTTGRPKTSARSRKTISEDDEDEEDDVEMPDVGDDDEQSDSQAMFVKDTKKSTRATSGSTRGAKTAAKGGRAAASTAKSAPTRKTPARGAAASKTGTGATGKQGTLTFSASQASVLGRGSRSNANVNVEEIDDDSDGFEEMSQPVRRRR